MRLGEFEELILLAILHLEATAYAVSVQQCIIEKGKRPTTMGAIYTGLDRLEAKGFVTSELGTATPERGGRRKRYYRVTGQGQQALLAAQATRSRMWSGITLDASLGG
ncbi:MAG: hypothetical protein RhofKO_04870 [Rhodothermales bacterium]